MRYKLGCLRAQVPPQAPDSTRRGKQDEDGEQGGGRCAAVRRGVVAQKRDVGVGVAATRSDHTIRRMTFHIARLRDSGWEGADSKGAIIT